MCESRWWRLTILVLWGGLTAGCGKGAFPKDLFTVEAADVDYPFMLSESPSKRPGRSIHAESGMHAAMSQSSYSAGNTTVTVTRTEHGQSELGASSKLATQVRRSDRYLQLQKATFVASDFATYGASASDRMLSIEATAHR